jgi:hypothetical protein
LSKNEVFDADHPPTLRSSALGEGDTIIGEREVGANDVVLVERLKAGGGVDAGGLGKLVVVGGRVA